MRVCQFRHDGKSDLSTGQPRGSLSGKNCTTILQAHRLLSNFAMRLMDSSLGPEACGLQPEAYPSSFAVIVIFALSTFDTGQPLLAFSAAFWNAA